MDMGGQAADTMIAITMAMAMATEYLFRHAHISSPPSSSPIS
jgi:hypothetical protein